MGAKLKASAVLLVVFGLGVGCGLAWQTHRNHHRSARNLWGERRIALLKQELQLNPWQEETLRDIVQDARERAQDINDAADYDLAKIRADSVQEIQGVLDERQRQQFAELRARLRAKHHRSDMAKPEPKTPSEGKAS